MNHKTFNLSLIGFVTLTVLFGLVWITLSKKLQQSSKANFVPTPSALPEIQTLPEYLLVFPSPGKTSHASEGPPDGQIKHEPFQASFSQVDWKPGNACVVFNASFLLELGDFWEREEVLARSTLRLNGRYLKRATWVDGIVDHTVYEGWLDENGYVQQGKPLYGTGGPYGICWHGPTSPGQYVAEFQFAEGTATSEIRASYKWWYLFTE
jgi:hypothetical protein